MANWPQVEPYCFVEDSNGECREYCHRQAYTNNDGEYCEPDDDCQYIDYVFCELEGDYDKFEYSDAAKNHSYWFMEMFDRSLTIQTSKRKKKEIRFIDFLQIDEKVYVKDGEAYDGTE